MRLETMGVGELLLEKFLRFADLVEQILFLAFKTASRSTPAETFHPCSWGSL